MHDCDVLVVIPQRTHPRTQAASSTGSDTPRRPGPSILSPDSIGISLPAKRLPPVSPRAGSADRVFDSPPTLHMLNSPQVTLLRHLGMDGFALWTNAPSIHGIGVSAPFSAKSSRKASKPGLLQHAQRAFLRAKPLSKCPIPFLRIGLKNTMDG